MKKGLFLLPLAGALLLSGCTFNLFGKTITLFEKSQESGGGSGSGSGGTGGGGGSGGGGSGGGSGGGGGSQSGGVTPSGTKVATMDLKTDHATVKTDEQVVVENGGATVTVDRNGSKTVCGGEKDGTHQAYVANPLRIYSGQKVTIELNSSFKQMLFDCPVYSGGDDFSSFMAGIVEAGGYAESVAYEKTKVLVTLSSEATSWEYVVDQLNGAYKQNRYYSIEFYK